LNELVSETRTEQTPGSIDVGIDVLELRVSDNHPVKAHRMTHAKN